MVLSMATELPSWVSDLRGNLEAGTGALGPFSWLTPDKADAVRSEWLDIWSQVAFETTFHAKCRERLDRCVPFAVGPTRERRLSRTVSRLTLIYDPAYPDMLAASLSHAIPSLCWSSAPADQLAEVLAPYLAETPVPRSARLVRLVKPLEVDTPQTIADAIDTQELWVDDTFWSSSCAEDPWIDVSAKLNMLSLSVYVQRFSEHDPNRFPSVGCRTLWSRSTMRIAQHPRGLFVFELRYRPARDATAMQQLSQIGGKSLPRDLPMDLAASLLRGATLDMQAIEHIERQGNSPFEALALRCAVAPSAPATLAHLRKAISQHRNDEEMLAGIASLASSYHHDALLFEIAHVANRALRSEIESFLRPPAIAQGGS